MRMLTCRLRVMLGRRRLRSTRGMQVQGWPQGSPEATCSQRGGQGQRRPWGFNRAAAERASALEGPLSEGHGLMCPCLAARPAGEDGACSRGADSSGASLRHLQGDPLPAPHIQHRGSHALACLSASTHADQTPLRETHKCSETRVRPPTPHPVLTYLGMAPLGA